MVVGDPGIPFPSTQVVDPGAVLLSPLPHLLLLLGGLIATVILIRYMFPIAIGSGQKNDGLIGRMVVWVFLAGLLSAFIVMGLLLVGDLNQITTVTV